jgi:hypothetical protein
LIYEARMTRTSLLLSCCILVAACGDSGLSGDPDMAMQTSNDDMAVRDMRMSAAVCDLVKQNCADASKAKCTISIDQQGQSIDHVCVAEGNKDEGQSCARNNMAAGDDDCKKGLFCTARGLPSGELACRKYCQKDGDCLAGQKCSGLEGKDGICTPTCEAFTSGCPTGTTCGTLHFGVGATQMDPKAFLACRPGPGAIPAYGDCSAQGAQCGADSLCADGQTDSLCLPLCDQTHPCPQPANAGVDGGVVPFDCVAFGDINVCDNSGP